MNTLRIILAVFLLQLTAVAYAHPGKTDANGCHTEKKTGEYHCHNSTPKTAKTEARASAPTGKVTLICTANIYNCADFSSHSEAQTTYESCVDMVGDDIHDLDRDSDGIACEDLQ
jgi:hypothetical protein